jgi:uncharacterized protein YabE (DUF348 family)
MPKLGRRLFISFIVSLSLFGLLVFEGTKAKVTLVMNGDEIVKRTHANTVKDFLEDNKIDLNKEDEVYPGSHQKITAGMKIQVTPAKEVVIENDGEEQTVLTTSKTVEDVLKKFDIDVSEHDKVTPDLDEEVKDSMKIKINKAFQIPLIVGNKQESVWTTSTTVADLLKHQEIKLQKLDRVNPDLQKTITEDSKVKVTRVEKVTDVVEEPIDYGVVTKRDSSMIAGNERVVEPGEKGLVKKHYEVILENGKEVSRELIETEKVKESKDQVVAMGTKQVDAEVSRGGEAAKTVYMKATAYTAYCNGCSGTTRTGINLRENPELKVVAVDPNVIPLGTKVWVEGYGYAIAADTGGAIKGNRIDLFIPDKQKVHQYGVQTVQVKILK